MLRTKLRNLFEITKLKCKIHPKYIVFMYKNEFWMILLYFYLILLRNI